jgi:hypothetical protein
VTRADAEAVGDHFADGNGEEQPVRAPVCQPRDRTYNSRASFDVLSYIDVAWACGEQAAAPPRHCAFVSRPGPGADLPSSRPSALMELSTTVTVATCATGSHHSVGTSLLSRPTESRRIDEEPGYG